MFVADGAEIGASAPCLLWAASGMAPIRIAAPSDAYERR